MEGMTKKSKTKENETKAGNKKSRELNCTDHVKGETNTNNVKMQNKKKVNK